MDAFAICGYIWTAWVIVWVLWAFQSKKIRQREDNTSRISYSIVVWASAYLIFFGGRLRGFWHYEIIPYASWLGWAGIVITALGFAFALWARLRLGSNWSGTVTIKVGHTLIRTGPYRWVRHPIYTGIVIAMAGTAIALNQWRGVVAVFVLWVALTMKRLKEEEFMRQTFGAQYIEYSQTTGAIFPLLMRRHSSTSPLIRS